MLSAAAQKLFSSGSLTSLTKSLPSTTYQPVRWGRFLPPGTLFVPHKMRFDENCDPLPPIHPETPRFNEEIRPGPDPYGKVYDKKPFRMVLKANKVYWWCSCGYSKLQPLCDGHHQRLLGQTPHYFVNKTKYKPIKLQFEKDTEVWFCNCKQSKHRPYCDGTHKDHSIQSQIKN